MSEEEIPTKTYAWFFLRGADLYPNEVTQRLNITPSYQFAPGDRHGEHNELVRKAGFWSISSKEQVQASNLEAHVEWLLDKLEPTKEHLSSTLKESGFHAQLTCVLNLFQREWAEELSPEIVRRLGALNVRVSVSVYCLSSE